MKAQYPVLNARYATPEDMASFLMRHEGIIWIFRTGSGVREGNFQKGMCEIFGVSEGRHDRLRKQENPLIKHPESDSLYAVIILFGVLTDNFNFSKYN